MRLWSLHPRYLDAKGLVALWREGLLAQQVLRGKTRGYRAHPQLERFRQHPQPVAAIAAYLKAVANEADSRRIARTRSVRRITVTDGQLRYELRHLRAKLRQRDPRRLRALPGRTDIEPHTSFRVIDGAVETWERRRLG